ncbi:MAG: hypothetical protein IKU29_08210 [Parabacteroides sp.]|nr:hypothetical protein [Parabacteroides sp.]
MNTKSRIQIIHEQLIEKSGFVNDISELLENYTIEDSIFENKGGMAIEVWRGYFEKTAEYSQLSEAIDNMQCKQVLRIVNNKLFQIGNIYQSISECKCNVCELIHIEPK